MATRRWKVEILPVAQRALDSFDDRSRDDAMSAIYDLSSDPFPPGAIPLEGHRDYYRIKCSGGLYRIIYQLAGRQRVLIWRVGPRGSVYAGFWPFRRD